MDADTIRDAMRKDEAATLRALADHIAQTYTGPEDTRIEIAHAIARHLGLEGWPSASPWRPIETAPKYEPILMLMKHGAIQGQWDGETGFGYYWQDLEWWPTHWMALPEPPKGGDDA